MAEEIEAQQSTPQKKSHKIWMIVAAVFAIALPITIFGAIFGAFYNPSGTWNKPTASLNASTGAGAVIVGTNCTKYDNVKLTGYWPATQEVHDDYDRTHDKSVGSTHKMEGGINDRKGRLLQNLNDYLKNKYTGSENGNYASIAADFGKNTPFTDKELVYIPSVEIGVLSAGWVDQLTGIVFRITDTGSAFTGEGAGKMDIAVNSMDFTTLSFVNATTTVYAGNGCTRAAIGVAQTTSSP